jgi:glycosyltransferase involved in cell wall biosynthesis
VLCGKNPTPEVLALASAQIEVTGTVPSVTPTLDAAVVYANALFEGAGSSLKTLEPLGSGIPLVATEVGMRGFDLEKDVHYIPARSPSEFATAILDVLANRASYDAMADRARAEVQRYDWSAIGDRLTTCIESLVSERRR